MIGDAPLDAGKLLRDFQRAHPDAGGIVSFTGQVRAKTHTPDEVVQSLYLQSHPVLTEAGIRDTLVQAQDRWPLDGICVAHRTGEIPAGETIVFVATAARHRRAAFQSADFIMDYLKTEAIFWKRETTTLGTRWIEPRADDYTDAKRWQSEDTP